MKKLIVVLLMFAALNASAQWVQMSNGMGTNTTVNALAVSGNTIYAGTDSNGVYFSTNYGSSWTQTSLNDKSVNAILVSGNNIFAGTNAYGVFLSSNGGNNWAQTSLNNKYVTSLSVNGNTIFAGVGSGSQAGSGVFISTNNGANWTASPLINIIVYSVVVIGGNIFAGTVYDYSNSGGVYMSTNNGENWTQTSLNNMTVQCLTGSGSNIFAAVDFEGVYKSTNNGVNWNQTALDYTYGWALASYNNYIFAGANFVNLTNNGGIFQTSNNGISWIQQNQGFPNYPSCSAILITNNYIFTGLYSRSVWRRSLSEIIGVQNISMEIPAVYSLAQNYPNPFNPVTNIKFSIIKSDVVKLIVYDITGREVQMLVNERIQPGSYETKFDGSSLNSGVYFYKLTSGDFSETKRMVLIK